MVVVRHGTFWQRWSRACVVDIGAGDGRVVTFGRIDAVIAGVRGILGLGRRCGGSFSLLGNGK
jgi:hypothetical protein